MIYFLNPQAKNRHHVLVKVYRILVPKVTVSNAWREADGDHVQHHPR